jgi:rare lipoprotein A
LPVFLKKFKAFAKILLFKIFYVTIPQEFQETMKKILIGFLALAINLTLITKPIEAKGGFFLDVPTSHPNFVAITSLKERGIINGFSDGTFKPELKINRAEALKILILGSGYQPPANPSSNPFPDVDLNTWFAGYVQKGKDLGVVNGTGDGFFLPDKTVNKAEALKLMVNLNDQITVAKELESNPYLDVNHEEWFAPYFDFARSARILPRTSNAYPGAKLTRGEFSELIYRLAEYQNPSESDIGIATYYADFFEGRSTSSGEIFDQSKFTAAHLNYPLGSKIQVTSMDEQNSIIVQVNDRGPYVRGHVVDLTTTGFAELAPLSRGINRVRVTNIPDHLPVGPPSKETCGIKNNSASIKTNAYQNITLDQELPTVYQEDEVVNIKGSIANSQTEYVTAFYDNDQGDQQKFIAQVENGRFTIPVIFDQSGNYFLSLLAGLSGQTTGYSVEVYDPLCQPSFPESSGSFPHNFKTVIKGGDAHFTWKDDWNQLFKIEISQAGNKVSFLVNNAKSFNPPAKYFQSFDQGLAKLRISGAPASSLASSSQTKNFHLGIEEDIYLVKHHPESIIPRGIDNLVITNQVDHPGVITFSGRTDRQIQDQAVVILPTGQIVNKPIAQDNQGQFSLSFETVGVGPYIVEINEASGFALINSPVVTTGFVPLLPNYWDLAGSPPPLQGALNLAGDRGLMLSMINQKRREAGLNEVGLNDNLNALAQFRADDMRDRDYYSHTDPDGKTVNDYLVEHAVKTTVTENIAVESNLMAAHANLWHSPIHRLAILNPSAQNIGLGLTKNTNGEVIVVQLFAEDEFTNEELEVSTYRQQVINRLNDLRQADLKSNDTLNLVAQNWSQKMTTDNFFDFEGSNSSLVAELKNAGVQAQASALIFQENSITNLLESISNNEIQGTANPFLSSNWQKIGVGVFASETGTIKATIIVSE